MMMAGILQGARITEYLIDWMLPWLQPVETLKYEVQEIEYDGDVWTVAISGLMSAVDREIGGFHGPRCGVEVFSQGIGMCNLAKVATYTTTAPVGSVIDPYRLFNIEAIFVFDDFGEGNWDMWRDGTLLWLTGSNAGHKSFIKQVPSEDRCELHTRTPYPIQVGDEISAVTGCDHRSGIRNTTGDCKNFYNNLINFQGEPYIAGKDATSRVGASLS